MLLLLSLIHGPDGLESAILKITGKISLVIKSLLFQRMLKILVAICQNDKQKIDYFPKKEALDDCYFQNSSF